ncbi:T6SS effector BTH_I2691 family protein [Xenorhabdus stockiae]|uniref:T6SS effector BTH_I2691 family protein n=1 Tax=Xenorhabdus stockiae TaxID=351614 RepID=UPI004063BACE
MSIESGCGFCQRRGLPVFPVRPAIMEREDAEYGIPELKDNIKIPVKAQGETAYTARILRGGFLYVYYEKTKIWNTYNVSDKGYYYFLPSGGSSPQCLNSEEKTICINDKSKLARASFITLYIMPKNRKNGIVWFAWSDAPWTEKIKKNHEIKEYRINNMQSFDVDAWLSNQECENIESLISISSVVAEYSEKSGSSTIKNFSSNEFHEKNQEDVTNLLTEANKLSPKKGAIIYLPDPVAILSDISSLCSYRIDNEFKDNISYARGLSLSNMLSSLKEVVVDGYSQFNEQMDMIQEQKAEFGYFDGEYWIPRASKERLEKIKNDNIKSLEKRAAYAWDKYEKYIDREKEKYFLEEYYKNLSHYYERVINPMVNMHINWLNSSSLICRFSYNYDPDEKACSVLYIQSVIDCIDGMTDKLETLHFIIDKLEEGEIKNNNFILRALIFNSEKRALELNESAKKEISYTMLPWNKIFDGAVESVGRHEMLLKHMEVYLNIISGAMIKVLEKGTNSMPLPAIIAIAANRGQAIKVVTYKAIKKHFISALLEDVSELLDIEKKIEKDKLRDQIQRRIKRLELDGVPIHNTDERKFILFIDMKELERIQSQPKQERIKESRKVLKSVEEVRKELFTGEYKRNLSEFKSFYIDEIDSVKLKLNSDEMINKIKKMQLKGCGLSLIFQMYVIYSTLDDGKNRKNIESYSKFYANVSGAIGTFADMHERLLKDFKNNRYTARLNLIAGDIRMEKIIKINGVIKKGFTAAGIVGVIWDAYHAIDEIIIKKDGNNKGVGYAYATSAVSGLALLLLSLELTALGGPIGILIATVILFGSAIYIAINERDDIQKWLLACAWRKIPADERDIPTMWATQKQEMESFQELMKPDEDKEKDKK